MNNFTKKILKIVLTIFTSCLLLCNYSNSAYADVKEPPIIVMPGIMGSNLYSDSSYNNRVWAPNNFNPFSSGNIYDFGENMKISNALYVKPARNQMPLSFDEREYGALDSYKGLVDRLCAEFPNREVYFFSYDFREDNEATAQKLKYFIDNVLKADSVDIVAHSMGGNISTHYLKENANKIHKLVFLGTPFVGAPKAIKAALDDAVVSETWNPVDAAIGLTGLNRNVKAGYDSIGNLFPSRRYFNVSYFSTVYNNGSKNDIDYGTYYRYCKAIFGNRYDKIVQEQADIENCELLLNLDNLYFGAGTGLKTISSVTFKDGNTLDNIGVDSLEYKNDGDGTVPLYSSTLVGKLQFYSKNKVTFFQNVSHRNLVSDSNSLNWVVNVLKK